jgi:type II secretory pathway pseudopilin PulG
MRAMTAPFRDSAGMTVVEVIVALGVITVGLLALIATMPLATSVIAESNLKTTATFLAQHRLEQIKNAQWTVVPAADTLFGAGSDGTAPVGPWLDEAYNTISSGGGGGTDPRFRRQVRIADCSVVVCSGIPTATASINTLRQVTVTVFFRPLSGTGIASANEEPVQLVTLIARRP